MPQALHLSIYKNPLYAKCSNGGITETHDALFVACETGPFFIDDGDPLLFDLTVSKSHTSLFLVPRNPQHAPDAIIGPMPGGAYAASLDSRWAALCRSLIGHPYVGAVPIHDRFETQAQYDALSR